ncbi:MULTISPECIES: lipid-A-disaccharide synthase N-terminal domain-containing protein [Altibacter]|uniref:lipid-A-disaccharide synthase N-terminal domain-containing protein n=1 Tax=Altibacter TaxID=1535231 RepID=UPI0005565D6F|nr:MULTISPECIES: lipid-A-disaccharide synthase N-terminal domain-containing protein [Altibacter]MCW8981728.1 lipid-A-disaccharide synthase N-terminal domain-containing protein [Altibacter sp.]MCW9038753.1 lipid-A-disaccharide synthase N-terminal domain-containing protein [Altibacter sp.]
MSNWLIYGIGFLAQLLFSGRLIVQWILSEKSKRVVTPSLFWKLSLLASFLLFVYGHLRDDFAIMLGQALTYYIYIRNLQLQGEWRKSPKAMQWFLLVFPMIVVVYAYNNGEYDLNKLFKNEDIPFWLLLLGIVSQVLFTLRFVYQWMYSERTKTSQLPVGFWRMSVLGASLILTYAIFRKDPVLFVGHVAGLIIYIRNIFIWKKQLHANS